MADSTYLSVADLAQAIMTKRSALGLTQKSLALASGTGVRFIVDLEKGKSTCHVGKVLAVLRTLGMRVKLQ